jgi:hypothetical protein
LVGLSGAPLTDASGREWEPMRALLFYPLLFLRPILKIFLRLLIVGALFGAGVMWMNGPNPPLSPWVFVVTSFLFFLGSHFYDVVLIKLNPTDTMLILQ